MDRLALVALVFLAGVGLGALGQQAWLLHTANSDWRQALDRAREATAQAVAAERRLAAARSQREQEAAKLEGAINASDLRKCPVPADVRGMLATAAAATNDG